MKNLSILLVEDSPEMRRAIKSTLRGLNATFLEREDGAQAVAAYNEHHPDWVLMDLKLKGMDGMTATGQIKGAHPEARIVIVTGFDDALLREWAEKLGVQGYVLKENMLELREILRN